MFSIQNNLKDVKENLCQWLNSLYYTQGQWDWYLTLTFRDEVRLGRAERLWRRFCHQVRSDGRDISYFKATEWHKFRRVPHFHAIMGNVSDLRRLTFMDKWYSMAGIARIKPYQHNKGVHYYLSKYITKENSGYADWDIELLPKNTLQNNINFS
jgi:hypothetical protein